MAKLQSLPQGPLHLRTFLEDGKDAGPFVDVEREPFMDLDGNVQAAEGPDAVALEVDWAAEEEALGGDWDAGEASEVDSEEEWQRRRDEVMAALEVPAESEDEEEAPAEDEEEAPAEDEEEAPAEDEEEAPAEEETPPPPARSTQTTQDTPDTRRRRRGEAEMLTVTYRPVSRKRASRR